MLFFLSLGCEVCMLLGVYCATPPHPGFSRTDCCQLEASPQIASELVHPQSCAMTLDNPRALYSSDACTLTCLLRAPSAHPLGLLRLLALPSPTTHAQQQAVSRHDIDFWYHVSIGFGKYQGFAVGKLHSIPFCNRRINAGKESRPRAVTDFEEYRYHHSTTEHSILERNRTTLSTIAPSRRGAVSHRITTAHTPTGTLDLQARERSFRMQNTLYSPLAMDLHASDNGRPPSLPPLYLHLRIESACNAEHPHTSPVSMNPDVALFSRLCQASSWLSFNSEYIYHLTAERLGAANRRTSGDTSGLNVFVRDVWVRNRLFGGMGSLRPERRHRQDLTQSFSSPPIIGSTPIRFASHIKRVKLASGHPYISIFQTRVAWRSGSCRVYLKRLLEIHFSTVVPAPVHLVWHVFSLRDGSGSDRGAETEFWGYPGTMGEWALRTEG
ncbi:hypothetical protein FB45DRAFT_874448 [Roridomyces roridus]|uniref:Uncharacterized protein n=1 Tax=Roridomyces roridus TaxID=1738132 RepID=A0AAD7B814_9AGAR|nr:hypothetical protein FB45DRAFT_874448 [Roridomyces roridus]